MAGTLIINREDESVSQEVFRGSGHIRGILSKVGAGRVLVIHSGSYSRLPVKEEIENAGVELVYYGKISPNPAYEDIREVAALFESSHCDAIIAVGGGSAMDTAKMVKLFAPLDSEIDYLGQTFIDSDIPLIAIPTTAGSGSEATRFAIYYLKGEKQSLAHKSLMPDYVILEPEVLRSLPMYQKKCCFLDALCQAIESWWSVQSTDQSREYAKKAIALLMKDMDAYLDEGARPSALTLANIMDGANYAGMAINFTQTTAPHAMCYKLTSLYGLPHGHAVVICVPVVWRFMLNNIKTCEDPRGLAHVENVFWDISREMGFDTVEGAIKGLSDMLVRLDIKAPQGATDGEFAALVASVNPDRLKNSPVPIDAAAVSELYKAVLGMR